MRNLNELDDYRIRSQFALNRFGGFGDATCGAFIIPLPGQLKELRIIASSGEGWDHISVSIMQGQRTPTWGEMEHVKRMFFKPDEVAMQLHVATDDHVNIHPYVLHLWRPHDVKIPLPPKVFV